MAERSYRVSPELYATFVYYAREAKKKFPNGFSARSIIHRMRWETGVNGRLRGSKFKVNDHLARPFARRLVGEDPSFDGFFEFRGGGGAVGGVVGGT